MAEGHDVGRLEAHRNSQGLVVGVRDQRDIIALNTTGKNVQARIFPFHRLEGKLIFSAV